MEIFLFELKTEVKVFVEVTVYRSNRYSFFNLIVTRNQRVFGSRSSWTVLSVNCVQFSVTSEFLVPYTYPPLTLFWVIKKGNRSVRQGTYRLQVPRCSFPIVS